MGKIHIKTDVRTTSGVGNKVNDITIDKASIDNELSQFRDTKAIKIPKLAKVTEITFRTKFEEDVIKLRDKGLANNAILSYLKNDYPNIRIDRILKVK